jgi:hypothetical protein
MMALDSNSRFRGFMGRAELGRPAPADSGAISQNLVDWQVGRVRAACHVWNSRLPWPVAVVTHETPMAEVVKR